jgi:hypothetical protein
LILFFKNIVFLLKTEIFFDVFYEIIQKT